MGHTGTLDPFATGVLPLVLGRATRLARFLSSEGKAYRATIALGTSTTTDDATGEPVMGRACTSPVPALDTVEQALARFRGRFDQQPPAFSAKRVGGVRAYRLARGETPFDLQAVPVELSRLEVEAKSFVAQVCSTAMWIGSVIGRASSCRTEAARCKRRWVVSTARLDG